MAALEDKSLVHGPLEALFTIDEETGMTGAFALKPNLLKGDILINLDSEDEENSTLVALEVSMPIFNLHTKTVPVPAGYTFFKLAVTGLKGGHSGMDINSGRPIPLPGFPFFT